MRVLRAQISLGANRPGWHFGGQQFCCRKISAAAMTGVFASDMSRMRRERGWTVKKRDLGIYAQRPVI